MFLRAFLPCDDVEVASDGAVSIVGVRTGDIPGARQPDGTVAVPRLMFVTFVSGLRGQEWLTVRHAVVGGETRVDHAARPEPHDPASDDHVFLYGGAPMVFPAPGDYEIETEVALGQDRLTASTTVRVTVT